MGVVLVFDLNFRFSDRTFLKYALDPNSNQVVDYIPLKIFKNIWIKKNLSRKKIKYEDAKYFL